jgi:exonuclease VII small subunit
MSNMSYCMFENTLSDLEQVVAAMENAETIDDLDMNEYELRAFHAMWRVARNFLAEHERLLNATEPDLSDCCYDQGE